MFNVSPDITRSTRSELGSHWDPRPHISYRQPGVPGDDHSDLPEFSFSHAVSSELRAHPEYIVLDLDLVRQMESTVTWWKKWLPIFLDGRNTWKHVETCGNYGHFMGEIQFIVRGSHESWGSKCFSGGPAPRKTMGFLTPGVVQKRGKYLEN